MNHAHNPALRYLKPLPSRLPQVLFWIAGVTLTATGIVAVAVFAG